MIFHQLENSQSGSHYNTRFHRVAFEPHFHKSAEILYVLEGSVNCTVGNRNRMLSAGEFGLCLPYEIHSYSPQGDCLYWVLVFSEDHAHTFIRDMQNRTGETFAFTCSETVQKLLAEKLMNADPPAPYAVKACIYALCSEYLASVRLIRQDKKTARIHEMIDYIQQNYRKNITLADAAAFLGYDYHYVSRYFKQLFNMSFKEFLNLYRLQTAAELLQDSTRQITDISFESGFQSVRAFNAAFKNHFKVSPSQYRKALLQHTAAETTE